MERRYRAFYWVADDHDEIDYFSSSKAGSRANKADALREIRFRKGRYIADRAEIVRVELMKD